MLVAVGVAGGVASTPGVGTTVRGSVPLVDDAAAGARGWEDAP
jgi:hypothetical protein